MIFRSRKKGKKKQRNKRSTNKINCFNLLSYKVARQEDENDGTVVDISDTVVVFAPIEMSSVITEANIIA
jgi:hypothetical protein